MQEPAVLIKAVLYPGDGAVGPAGVNLGSTTGTTLVSLWMKAAQWRPNML